MKHELGEPTDRRGQRRREQRRLFWIVVIFLLVVGSATIALVYGPMSALLGLMCLIVGAGIMALLYAILTLMERWSA